MSYPDYLCYDIECTGATNGTHGNAFTDSNRLCVIGYGNSSGVEVLSFLDPSIPTGPLASSFSSYLNRSNSISVGFNWKFDTHWLRRYGITLSRERPVWDCQLAHFIIHDQQHPLPSLEETASYYELEAKQTDIETEYWDKGIDNDKVPFDVLRGRVESDVRITSQLFELQVDYLRREPAKKNLIWLACQDQKVLQEMEYAGLLYDMELSKSLGDQDLEKIYEIDMELNWIIKNA